MEEIVWIELGESLWRAWCGRCMERSVERAWGSGE